MKKYKQWRIWLETYLKLNIKDKDVITAILKYFDDVIEDFTKYLERFESLLKIDGINSKSMVLNDIQYLLKGDEKNGNTK